MMGFCLFCSHNRFLRFIDATMSISINGLSTVPPGFRFHPTEEELLAYYLRKKVASENIDFNVIHDIDINKLEPWDIQEKCRIGSTAENDWYFFSHKDKKYPTGTRTNRATAAGFWKATGRDKVIYACCFKRIGMRKTLVYYKGRAPHGEKTDWIMHEYRLDELHGSDSESNFAQEEGWVICRVFKKKNPRKLAVGQTTCSPFTGNSMPPRISHSSSHSSLDQLRTTKSSIHNHSGGKQPRHPRPVETLLCTTHPVQRTESELSVYNCRETGVGDWAVLDRLVACDMGGYPFFPATSGGGGEDDGDLWSLTRSAFSQVSQDK